MAWRQHPRVGLVLGGGAARGLAHIGVLRALDRAGIPIDLIVGTSMGAIIGGAYAATGDVGALETSVRGVLETEAFRRLRRQFIKESKSARGALKYSAANLVRRGIQFGVSTMQASFLSAEEFAGSMARILPEVDIPDLRIPFAAVGLDLSSGAEVVMTEGQLRRACLASAAIPGLLPPVERNGRMLIDGGWVDKVPVLPAFRLGADVVLAVDITAELTETEGHFKGMDAMIRANAIRDTRLVGMMLSMADVKIEPAVKEVHWADFGALQRCVDAGDAAAADAVDRIRSVLRRERWASWFRPGRGRRMARHFLDRSPRIVMG